MSRPASTLVLVGAVSTAALTTVSCCPPFCRQPGNNPCATYIATTSTASDAVARLDTYKGGSGPLEPFQYRYLGREGTLSSRPPEDVVGLAFRMRMSSPPPPPPPLLPPMGLLGGLVLLQYDVPARECRSEVTWIIRPEVVFPTGYLFSPQNGPLLQVHLWTFADPQGMFDISTNDTLALNYANERMDDAQDDELAYRWTEHYNNPGPVYVSRRFQGKYVVQPRVSSHVFVAARLEFWMSSNEAACTGCTIEQTPLIDAGIVRGLSPGSGARDKGLYGPDFVITTIP